MAIVLSCLVSDGARGQAWVEHGPGPKINGQVEGMTDRKVVGAIASVAAHPTDAATIYVGAVNGGIWKTTNATAADPSWTDQLGLNRSLSIGAIAFDPTDATNMTLMAGSGRFSSFGGFGGDRAGVWRTTNGGTAWTLIDGGTAGLNISGVAPRGATLVVAANTADAFANVGIWRSTTTGASWTQISGGAGTGLPAGVAFDLASDPSNNAVLYTNAGGNGIYRSSDTGATWSKVSTAAMDALIGVAGNVEISVGASSNVYVAIVGGGVLTGLFRSPNGTTGWTSLDLPTTTELGVVVGMHPGGQGATHLSIAADRTNANVVYVGGDRQPFRDEFTTGLCTPCFPNASGANDFSGRLFRVDASQPAGSQAAAITHVNTASNSAPHADSRDMAIDANNNLIESDDGGVYRRSTPLTNGGDWVSLVGNLRTNELHSATWDSSAKVAFGGAQDNGVPEQDIAGDPRWRSLTNADGGDVAVNTTAGASVRYSSIQSLIGISRRTYNSANAFVSQVIPAMTVVGGGNAIVPQFYTPITVNNVTPTRLLVAGANSLYESTDQLGTIREIGVGLVVNSTPGHPLAYGATGNAEVIYAGSGDDVFIRTAAAPGAPVLSAAYLGNGTGRQVVDIAVNRTNAQNAFVIDATNVYRTATAGASWTNITGDLLTLSPGTLRSVEFSTSNAAGRVVVGTDRGVFSATGPAFNVWTALGTGLPRVPVFDLAYNATDEVIVAGTMGRGAWTISLDERTPVDVALVLDLSGSMLSPACPGCATRLQVLKDSVELFVQLWTIFAVPDDRLGLNYFRTNVSEFTPGGAPLFPVLANANALIADVQSQTTVGANLTAMGGGLQTAINRLNDATRPRNVILFTDGMQNVNPMVNTTSFVVENQPGFPASGVSPTAPATDLDAALARKVNTIGVGATAPFVELLDNIATETNGLFKLTTAPDDDLRRFYVEELIDVLRSFSPQLVAYRKGTVAPQESLESFKTNASAQRVAFKVSWQRGAKLDFTVEKEGVPIRRAGRFINGPFYKIFVIDVPTADASGTAITAGGDWGLRITGTPGARYEAAAIVDEHGLKYDFSIGGHDHVAGTPLPLNVRLTFGGIPVTGANVTARVLVPKIGLGTLLAKQRTPANLGAAEPGGTDAQRKYQLLLGDTTFFSQLQPDARDITLVHTGGGNYSATFNGTAMTGPYTAVFSVSGSSPTIGSYERTEERSVSVRFGTATLDASRLRIMRLGGRNYELHVTPIDANGNFLGPDYGDRVAVFLNGTPVAGPPRDLLDGTYVFTFMAADPVSSNDVRVTVLEQPLFDGPLSSIPTAGGAGRYAASMHLGSTIPVTGFASGTGNGYLWEADLEYRVTPAFSLEGVLGLYDFGSADAITGLTAYAKLYRPVTSQWRWYAAAGPGAFRIPGGSTELGASLAAGLNHAITPRTEFDTGAVYTHMFGEDAGWLGLRVGVKVSF
jgi:hypothetical protein